MNRLSAPPVPGLPLLGAEGLVGLDMLWLLKQGLSVLDQVVDPHGPVGCHPQHSLAGYRCTFTQVLGQRHVVHGQQESAMGTETCRQAEKDEGRPPSDKYQQNTERVEGKIYIVVPKLLQRDNQQYQ